MRDFINDERNSRIPLELPRGVWDVATSVQFDDGFAPTHVLAINEYFIVQGEGAWNLYNHDLTLLTSGYLAAGQINVDENGFFYLASSSGALLTYQLDNGEKVSVVPSISGEGFEPSFIARRGQRLIVISRQRELDAHTGERPLISRVEVIHLGDPPELDAEGWLISAFTEAALDKQTSHLSFAMQEEQLIIMIENALISFKPTLQAQRILLSTFKPVSLSLDEAGRMYLLVDVKGKLVFWLVTPVGERIIDYELPSTFQSARRPLIIGFNHSVYILAKDKVLSVASDGTLQWENTASGTIIGAFVSLDNQLVVSTSSDIGVFNPTGEWKTLHTFKGETVLTPPLLTSSGQLVVATDQRLVFLKAR